MKTASGLKAGMEPTFTRIYKNNSWKCEESVSGLGSTLEATKKIREKIPVLLDELNVKSMLDIPCGDFNWMRHVRIDAKYIGGDIVDKLVESDKKNYENSSRHFMKLNLIKDKLPKVELVMCRDCLVHFSFKDINAALINLKKSGSKYLLTTTYPSVLLNQYITTGEWMPLNLERVPFFFPKPLLIINEGYHKWRYSSKSLGLWRIEDIEINDVDRPYSLLKLLRHLKNFCIFMLSKVRGE